MALTKRPRETLHGTFSDNLINKAIKTHGKASMRISTNLSGEGNDLFIMETYMRIQAAEDSVCYVIIRDGMILSVHNHCPDWDKYVNANVEFDATFPKPFTFITPVLMCKEEHQFVLEQLICYVIEPSYKDGNCTVEFRSIQLDERKMVDAMAVLVSAYSNYITEYYNHSDLSFVVWYNHDILNESKIMTDKHTRFNIGSYTFKNLSVSIDKMIPLHATNIISYHIGIKVNGFNHLLFDPHLFLLVNHTASTLRLDYSYTKPGYGLPVLYMEQDHLLRVRDAVYCFCYSSVCTYPVIEDHASFHQQINIDMPVTPFKGALKEKQSLHVFLFKYRS